MPSVADYLDSTSVSTQIQNGLFGEAAITGSGGYNIPELVRFDSYQKDLAQLRVNNNKTSLNNLIAKNRRRDATVWYKSNYENIPDRRVDAEPIITQMVNALTLMDEVFYEPSANYPFADGKIIPFKPNTNPLAKFVKTNIVMSIGELRRGNIEVLHIPETDVVSFPEIYKIETYWGGYRMNEVEMALQLFVAGQGDPLGAIDIENLKSQALDEALKRKQQEIQIVGDIEVGIPGVLSGKNRQMMYSPYTIDENSEPAQILSIMNALVRKPQRIASSQSSVIPNYVAMPYSIAQIMNSLMYTQSSGTVASKTVMEQFLASNPHIKGVEPLDALEADNIAYYTRNFPRGAIKKPIVMAYCQDPRYMFYMETQPWSMLPPKTTWGGQTIRAGKFRTAGVINKFVENLFVLVLDQN